MGRKWKCLVQKDSLNNLDLFFKILTSQVKLKENHKIKDIYIYEDVEVNVINLHNGVVGKSG